MPRRGVAILVWAFVLAWAVQAEAGILSVSEPPQNCAIYDDFDADEGSSAGGTPDWFVDLAEALREQPVGDCPNLDRELPFDLHLMPSALSALAPSSPTSGGTSAGSSGNGQGPSSQPVGLYAMADVRLPTLCSRLRTEHVTLLRSDPVFDFYQPPRSV